MSTSASHISRDSSGLSCSVTSSFNFLLPPNSLSLGCLLPLACYAPSRSGLGVSPHQVTELSTGPTLCGPQYKASSRRLLCEINNRVTCGGGCESRLELATRSPRLRLALSPCQAIRHEHPAGKGSPQASPHFILQGISRGELWRLLYMTIIPLVNMVSDFLKR